MSSTFVSTKKLLEAINDAAPSTGGAITIERLTQRLTDRSLFRDNWSQHTRESLVRRALEWQQRKRGPMFLEVTATGKIATRRPKGVEPVGREVLFEPRSDS